MQSVGFIGLGHMGANMAVRYLDAGYTVYGHSRTKASAQTLIDRGLQWRDTPRELAQSAEIILSSLPNDAIVESVADGPDGVIAGLNEGKLWADLSTISPAASRALAARVSTEGHGGLMLDTPVSGSIPQVKTGTLTIMVGGDQGAFETLKPVLAVLGNPVHVGKNGHGLALKLAVNISLGLQALAFSEGLLLAERAGVDPQLAAETMAASSIGSPMLKARVPLFIDPSETWFDISLQHKDIRLALDVAREQQIPTPAAQLADEVLSRASEHGYEHRDIAALHEFLSKTPRD